MYQFARDAAVAEAWLIAQEPYLMSTELGHTIDEVENLIKKHEAFEKSAAAQEERFSALERLTTVRFLHPTNQRVHRNSCPQMQFHTQLEQVDAQANIARAHIAKFNSLHSRHRSCYAKYPIN